ncbi:hypothetical protein C1701_13765 [Actinoalloteichus sp. AHMU CJ021]|uniref:Uncharacterized protein n=1 Tax=Actinoalloteichus caeruleus DSM 43889 TaxID=1120930 RepID=A0ABT1JLW5_ACTCY|nr:hypothetical protein [Actinoalloteichus caeruleus]AUS79251.1 hypothetical protein C1701_13765 [Actinoalloteichus sp. AHMU CJ021]MCP2333515.1 hypothetical protein [Actinoalloteichus caeruleus DSM 43889]
MRLRVALVVAAAGGVLVALAPVVGVTDGGHAPAYASWPWMALVGLLAPAVGLLLITRGRPVAARWVLLGPALVALGRLVLDVQVAVEPALAARPELFLLDTLDPVSPSVGLVLSLVGSLLVLLAGLLALSEPTGGDGGARLVDGFGGENRATSGSPGLLALVLCVSVAAAAGVLTRPFESETPYLLPSGALEGAGWERLGLVVVAVAVVLAATFAATSSSGESVLGGLVGAALALAWFEVPVLLAGLLGADLRAGWGPVVALLAAALLAALGLVTGLRAARPSERRPDADTVVLPGSARLRRAAGLAGLAAGVAAVLAATGRQLVVVTGADQPPEYPARLLVPAGLLVVGLSVAMLVPRWSVAVRPAFVVGWTAVPLAVTSALEPVLMTLDYPGVELGAGAWASMASVPLAVLAGVLALVAGAGERDDVDLSERTVNQVLAVPVAMTLLWSVGAFGLPVLTGRDFAAAGLWNDFRVASLGLVVVLIAVVVAAALAPFSRPGQAVGLLLGAAALLALRMLELPLTVARVADGAPGAGLWLAGCCLVSLVVGAVLAARSRRGAATFQGSR